ncbi:hypothetical protein RHMOL_Rhmol01G0204800 [Rhododendron molle]|uniref:Uncharacterized protein n=1 Tax=Rhododendron molle TaxID=49168 RepID=A0ACC0Q4Y6_RHOML|nr:hypothetical protein RHMOL_Rhmol01G0204800 [Rhododendron molle]
MSFEITIFPFSVLLFQIKDQLIQQLVWNEGFREKKKGTEGEGILSLVWKGQEVREGERRRETGTPSHPGSVSHQKWRDSVRKGESEATQLPAACVVHPLVGSSSYLHRCLRLVKEKLLL